MIYLKCSRCNESKLFFRFIKCKTTTNGFRSYCKSCRSAQVKRRIKDKASQRKEGILFIPKNQECTICHKNLPINDFYKDKYSPTTHGTQCKHCLSLQREQNKTELRAKSRKFYENNKESELERGRIYREKNREQINARMRKFNHENPEKVALRNKKWRKNNKEKWRKYINKYIKRKKKEDVQFLMKWRLRDRLQKAVRAQNAKKSASTLTLCGCTKEFIFKYLESFFTPGMTWEKFRNGEIHIDHIIPCHKFDLTDPEQQKKCFHYSNLQLLWEKDHIAKSAKETSELNKKSL